VRLLFGLALLILTAVNHFLLSLLAEEGATNQLAESVGVFYAVLLLLQAAIEYGKESKGFVVSLDRPEEGEDGNDGVIRSRLTQRWSSRSMEQLPFLSSSSSSSLFQERVEWAAASFVALTPATGFLLIDRDMVLYQLRTTDLAVTSDNNDDDKDDKDDNDSTSMSSCCKSAISTLAKARSGRVSIPMSHPAAGVVTTTTTTGDNNDRTIVLQDVVKNQCCFMITSDQVLQSFTEQDLKWLGQMATYVTLEQ